MMMMMSLCQWTMTQMWHSIEKMLEEILHASDTREHASRSEILKTHFKNVILILLKYYFRKKIKLNFFAKKNLPHGGGRGSVEVERC